MKGTIIRIDLITNLHLKYLTIDQYPNKGFLVATEALFQTQQIYNFSSQ